MDEDGIINIYINEGMPDRMKRRTIKHEVEHAQRGDFESDLPVELLEASNNADSDLAEVCWLGRNQLCEDIPIRTKETRVFIGKEQEEVYIVDRVVEIKAKL